MLKEKILKIKEIESPAIFGRKNSDVRELEIEINSFVDYEEYKNLSFMDKVRFILDDFKDYYDADFKFVFETHLTRVDGKINSPLLKNKHVKNFISRLDNEYQNLKNYNLEHKWFYLKNELIEIPKCDGCNKPLENFTQGKRFCSQHCAVTSDEAKQRSSKTSKGRTHSDEQKKQNSIRMKQLWKTESHRRKVIPKLKESNQSNGKHFLKDDGKPWNYGISPSKETIEKALKTKKERGIDYSGKNNPQFGKSPSPKAGRGMQGYYKKVWFRSSLELFYLMYFDENKIQFESAETQKYKVEYLVDGVARTYSPDFYLLEEDKIIEVKPKSRITEKTIKLKMKALKEKFGENNCEFRTELDIKDFIDKVSYKVILDKIKNKELEMTNQQQERLLKSFKRIKDDYSRNI